MAITEVNELNERHGPLKASDFHSEYTRAFEAISDSATESGDTVLADPRLPRLWLPHPDNFNARCIHVDPKRHGGDDFYWRIDFRYSTRYPAQLDPATGQEAPQQGDPSDANPLLRPLKLKIVSRKFRKTIDRELRPAGFGGQAFRNSAGDPYPPKEIEPARMALSVQRNVAQFDYFVIETLVGQATNNEAFLGWEAGVFMLDDLNVTFEREHGTFFAAVDALLVIDSNKWVDERLDAGFNYLAAGNKKKAIVLPGGQLPSVPQLLNGTGGQLGDDPALQPKYRQFFPLLPSDFSPLAVLFN